MKEMDIVCGIMKNGDRYLIAKRAAGVHENIWEFPGGKVEQNETREEAIIREIKEELELDVIDPKYLTTIIDAREDVILHVHAYLCQIAAGTIKLHAHHTCAWVTIDELFHYNFESADQPILDALKARVSI